MASHLPPQPRRSGARDLALGFAAQRRVVAALMLRELHTRYGRDNIGYLWLFLEPAMLGFMVGMIHLISGFAGHIMAINPVAFALVGYIVFILFRSVFLRADNAISSNASLLNHRLVKLQDIMLARSLLDGIGTVLAYGVLVGICIALGWATLPPRPFYVGLAIAFMLVLSHGAACMYCAASYRSHLVERFAHPLTYISMPLSGCFYEIAWLSPATAPYFKASPMSQIFEMLRYGQFESAPGLYFSPSYIIIWLLILNVLGFAAIKHVEPEIEVG